MRLISWNVNGIRAVAKKGFVEWLQQTKPDILCLQETKVQVDQLSSELLHPDHYKTLWNCGERKGYSGVAMFSSTMPIHHSCFFDYQILDAEGRVLMAEFPEFYLFNVYFPNGGSGEVRLKYKLEFYQAFLRVMNDHRNKGKGVIVCGDINTAHHPIDLARPKENEHVSGFLPIERDWLDRVLSSGYVDTFRHFNPDQPAAYTWWDMKTGARDRNVGWRIDYFLVSEDLLPRVKNAFIMPEVLGSDHCPIGIIFE